MHRACIASASDMGLLCDDSISRYPPHTPPPPCEVYRAATTHPISTLMLRGHRPGSQLLRFAMVAFAAKCFASAVSSTRFVVSAPIICAHLHAVFVRNDCYVH